MIIYLLSIGNDGFHKVIPCASVNTAKNILNKERDAYYEEFCTDCKFGKNVLFVREDNQEQNYYSIMRYEKNSKKKLWAEWSAHIDWAEVRE